jgi:hypothetical protein
MNPSPLDAFTRFFDDLPDVVRAELSFVLVTLTAEGAVEIELMTDYEEAARGLFASETHFGRLGDLISAAAVIDVYFAADPRDRFAPSLRRIDLLAGAPAHALKLLRDRYAATLAAIHDARRAWEELRRTVLAPAALSEALQTTEEPTDERHPADPTDTPPVSRWQRQAHADRRQLG